MSDFTVPPVTTTSGVAYRHAELAQNDPRKLARTALRTKSIYAREVLAAGMWPGHSPADVDAWADGAVADLEDRDGPTPSLAATMNPTWAMFYAQVLAVQLGATQERRRGRAMLEAVANSPAWAKAPRPIVELLLHLRVSDGARHGALTLCAENPRIRPDVVAASVADLHNPHLVGDQFGGMSTWLEHVNAALHSPALANFSVSADEAVAAGEHPNTPHFDRLQGPTLPSVEAPLRVTVLMSAYRPGRGLLTAVRSVLAQTWGNFELIIVDDASGPEYASVLQQAQELDPRVTVIPKAINGGTYRARNTALRVATGDVAIVLDSDDWWHPQALEVSIRPLLQRPDLMATRSQGSRVSERLELTRIGYSPRVLTAASLMFRLSPVTSRIGFFDPTVKGADNEFALRMIAAFGEVIYDIPEALCLVRGGQTLSSTEFSNGWRHPARHQYRNYFGSWHSKITSGNAAAFLDPDERREFREPRRWQKPVLDGRVYPYRYDLCLAGDWRRFGGPQRSMIEEIKAARHAGLQVAIMHLEALRFMTDQDYPLCEPIMSMLRAGEVDWIHADDQVEIDVLMIRYPSILQYPPHLTRTVDARHVWVMANQAPGEPDGSDQRYVVADVSKRTAELFGRPVHWLPQSPFIRRLLQQQDPNAELLPWDNPGLIDVPACDRPGRGAPDGTRPVVVGRYSRDDAIKFPQTYEELLRGYAFADEYHVRMMGAERAVRRLHRKANDGDAQIPRNWTLLPYQAMPVDAFLDDLDFFLYLDNASAHEAFGRTLLEAAASGVLTIAHPKHRETFAETIDYAMPGEAQDLIAHYVANPDDYRARVEQSRAQVVRRYGHQGFAQRLRPLLSESKERSRVSSQSHIGEGTITVRICGSHQGPAQVVTAGRDHDVLTIPVRSAADGARADGLSVVYRRGLSRRQLGSWLNCTVQQASVDAQDHELLDTAPVEVEAVVSCRDGLIKATGRGRWDTASASARVEASYGPTAHGWDLRSWWGRNAEVELVLSAALPVPKQIQAEATAKTA